MADHVEQAARTTPIEPRPTPETRRASTAKHTVNVSVTYPTDVFHPGVDGVPELTATPIAVAETHMPQVRDAAARAGVTLQED